MHDHGELVAIWTRTHAHGRPGGCRVGEQQRVRHILPAPGHRLLGQEVPPEQAQDREDQAFFGDGLIGSVGVVEGVEGGACRGGEAGNAGVRQGGPAGHGPDAAVEKIPAEQTATEHAPATPAYQNPNWQN